MKRALSGRWLDERPAGEANVRAVSDGEAGAYCTVGLVYCCLIIASNQNRKQYVSKEPMKYLSIAASCVPQKACLYLISPNICEAKIKAC